MTGVQVGASLALGPTVDFAEPSIRSDSHVKSSAKARWVLLGAVSLGALVFGLSQWPQSEPPPEAADAETDVAADEKSEEPGPERQESEEEPEAEVGMSDEVIDAAAEGSAAGEIDNDPTAPLLPESTGLGLVLSTGSATKKLVDLDTGDAHEFRAPGNPVAMIGSSIVLQSLQGDSVLLFDLMDPEGEAVPLEKPQGTHQQIMSIDDELIWTSTYNFNDRGPSAPTIEAFDERGHKFDELAGDNAFQFGYFGVSADLFQVNGSGIYRRDGAEFRRVSDGALVAAGEGLALVDRCDERLKCGSVWYRRPDWTEISDLPSPEVGLFANLSITGDDKWLVAADWNSQSADVVEIATGRTVHSMRTEDHYYGPSWSLPMSEDGRWLVDRRGAATMIVDLFSGAEYEVDLGTGAWYGRSPIFVEMDSTAFG